MRRFAALAAAALLTLALGAAGCKPSSLTPFGIGTRGPDTAGTEFNGLWKGTTASGGEIRFLVGNAEVSTMLLYHEVPDCHLGFEATTSTAIIVDEGFELEMTLSSQGRIVIEGRFTSPTTCTGSYFFEALHSSSTCPSSGSGTFVANIEP